MITLKEYEQAAKIIGCDVAAIKAVEEVESKGDGFLSDNRPMILFEPHIFWKQLKKHGIDPKLHLSGNEDILYPVWGTKPYGKYSEQHGKLERAKQIHRDAALCSASWGKFQIMGFNWKACGCETLQEFINKMYRSESEHLNLFCNYIKSVSLDDELIEKDWAGFAAGYNGPQYRKNNYDGKLSMAYQTYRK